MFALLWQEDYRKITVERKGEQNFFTSEMIKSCMKKVVAVNLHQTVQVVYYITSLSRMCVCIYLCQGGNVVPGGLACVCVFTSAREVMWYPAFIC